jgi:hypothetical protein
MRCWLRQKKNSDHPCEIRTTNSIPDSLTLIKTVLASGIYALTEFLTANPGYLLVCEAVHSR